MPRPVVEYRCLIISPGDVIKERDAIVDVIHRWNASVGANPGIRVEPVQWEMHTHPDLSGPAQAKLNEQIVDECDFGIAVFWSRVGTPTQEYDSGSVEEVERLARRGAKVMLYRSSQPIPPEKLDTRQYERLTELMHQYKERGLIGQFADINDLKEMVNKDLSLLLGREKTQDTVAAATKFYSEYGVLWDEKFNMCCLSCNKLLKNSSFSPSIFFCSDPKCNSKHVLKDNLGNLITKQEAINKIKGSG